MSKKKYSVTPVTALSGSLPLKEGCDCDRFRDHGDGLWQWESETGLNPDTSHANEN